MEHERVVKGRLGNWMAVSMKSKGKRLKVITIYRIPSTSSNGVKCSLTQCHRVDGNIRTTNDHRAETLDDVRKHVRNNTDVSDIIIVGDHNQNIGDKKIMQFHEDIGVCNIHLTANDIELNQVGKTYIHGSKPIDAVHDTKGVMDFVEGCKLIGNNDILE